MQKPDNNNNNNYDHSNADTVIIAPLQNLTFFLKDRQAKEAETAIK